MKSLFTTSIPILTFLIAFLFTLANADTTTYNGLCFGCVYNNNKYCSVTATCIPYTQSCKSGNIVYTNATGCPIGSTCTFGSSGTGFLGETSLSAANGFMDVNGTSVIQVPPSSPCALTVVNNHGYDVDFYIVGANVGAFYMTMQYPNASIIF